MQNAKIKLEGQLLKLSGELTFDTVPVLLNKGLTLMEDLTHVDIHLKGVTKSNSAGLVLLLEWQRFAKKRHKLLSFYHIPLQIKKIAKACDSEIAFLGELNGV